MNEWDSMKKRDKYTCVAIIAAFVLFWCAFFSVELQYRKSGQENNGKKHTPTQRMKVVEIPIPTEK